MATLALLFDNDGRQLAAPARQSATVSWTAREGRAQAFDAAGRCIAELHNARIDWIEPSGIRLSGMEPIQPGGTTYRTQAWQYKP